jgi:hypothetical protein
MVSFVLKMEAACLSEALVLFYQTTRSYVLGVSNLYNEILPRSLRKSTLCVCGTEVLAAQGSVLLICIRKES